MQPPPALPAPVAPRPPPPKPQGPPPQETVPASGSPKKKHGFIKPDGGGADVFVHQMDLRAGTEITEGDTVEFGTADYKGREKAVDVIKVDPAVRAAAPASRRRRACPRSPARDHRYRRGPGEGQCLCLQAANSAAPASTARRRRPSPPATGPSARAAAHRRAGRVCCARHTDWPS